MLKSLLNHVSKRNEEKLAGHAPASPESHTRLEIVTASGRESAATRARSHILIISSSKRVDDQ